ncbi:MAG: hypothetical protein ACYDHH_01515 [Solirubrobacteraceae bacterium]
MPVLPSGEFVRLKRMLGKRPPLVLGLLLAAGMLMVALAVTVGDTGIPSTRRSALLIVGCDLLIAAGLASTGRKTEHQLDLAAFVARCTAEAVYGVALASTALIVCFGQSKPAERLGYFMTALVVVPASVALSRRLSVTGSARRSLANSVVLLALTATAVCAARLTGSSQVSLKLLLMLVVGRAGIEPAMRIPAVKAALGRAAAGPGPLVAAATLGPAALAALAFMPGVDVHAGRVATAALAAVAIGWAAGRQWALTGLWRRAVDVAVVVIVGLGVFELHRPDQLAALNHNYFLGPANDVLHGHAVLVGTFSQYGLGMFDVLAGFFAIFPLGYGVLTLLLAGITALLFAVIYVVVRLGTRSQLVAALAVLIAGTLYVFGQPDFYTGFPSTGALRFGLPWIVVLLSVAAARVSEPRTRQWLERAVLVLVCAASVWSGEAGVYCLGTACAVACLDGASIAESGARRARRAAVRVLPLLGAYLLGILTFSEITLLAAGDWPHWGPYIDFIRLYTTQGEGAQPIGGWSPGLAIGAEYAASAAVLIGVVLIRPDAIRARPAAFRAAAGVTALGILVYTYFLGRSNPINLIHISPPAVALVFIWLGIALPAFDARPAVRSIAVACVAFLGGLIVIAQHLNVDQRFGETALGTILEHPGRTTASFTTLADNQPVTGGAVVVQQFVSSLRIGRRQLALLADPLIESEALFRLGMGNAAGTSQPCQEDLSQTAPPRDLARVRQLPVGSVLVLGSGPFGSLARTDQYSLALLEARFKLRPIGTDGRGLAAYSLSAVKPGWHGGSAVAQPVPVFQTVGSPDCG